MTIVLMMYLFSASDINKIKETMLSLNIKHFLLYVFFSLSNAFFRAYRYGLLLKPLNVPLSSLFGVTLLRNLFVDMFPAKLGALSYPAILNRRYRVPVDSCLSSFFYSFLFDVIALPPFLLFSLLLISGIIELPSKVIFIVSAVGIMLLTGFIIVYLQNMMDVLTRILIKIGSKYKLEGKKLYSELVKKLNDFSRAIAYLKKEGSIILIFLISLIIRLFKYLGLFFLFVSVYHFREAIDIKHFGQLVFGITAADFTAILPFQFFGGYGTWETAWTLVFQLFNYPKSDAAVVGLTVHAYSQIWEYSVGFLAFCIVILPYVLRSKSR
jgi:uncharacterized membrane protein YbhN (UPF0104 family)